MLINLHRSGANLNQLARRVNETGRFYEADLEDILQSQARLQAAADNILEKLSFLRSPSMAATPAREPQDLQDAACPVAHNVRRHGKGNADCGKRQEKSCLFCFVV